MVVRRDVVEHLLGFLEDDAVIVELFPHCLDILTHLTTIISL